MKFDSYKRDTKQHNFPIFSCQVLKTTVNIHPLFLRSAKIPFRMKITSLEGLRKDAKQKYNDALKTYVTQYFGRPLEKLTLFFDGIQQRLSAGIKESEIGYQVSQIVS